MKLILETQELEAIVKENIAAKYPNNNISVSIQNKRNGFYHLVEFKTENAELVSQLEVAYKRDERVLRFLTVKLDKHGMDWAEKRRTKLKSNSNK